MRWYYALFVGVVVGAVIGFAFMSQGSGWGAALCIGCMIAWLVGGYSTRCPRCRRHILDNGKGYHAPWMPIPRDCIGCGRGKGDVWPFQWLIRPEKSDPTG